MKAQIIQHVPFEGAGYVATWLDRHGAAVETTHLYRGDKLVCDPSRDLVVIMGGPMSVNDGASFPWLEDEKRYIQGLVRIGTPLLGICLGAQLIASALGARVYPADQKEIGWFPIETVGQGSEVFRFPETLPVFHWHGETFDLPAGSELLARSAACENQAFQIGQRIIGLQFHLETTPESVRSMLDACVSDLVSGGRYVQSGQIIERAELTLYAVANRVMAELLDYLVR